MARVRPWLVTIAIVAVALNLRPALAAIGPLLDMIEADTGASHTLSSLLTALPVFVMGACALGGRWIADRLGERRGVGLGIALVLAACVARLAVHGIGGLLLTAVAAGIGIALVQTLLPSFIKSRFGARAGSVFALYTTGIMGGAAIAAMSASGLATHWGWPAALAAWALPALLALLLWRLAARARTATGTPADAVATAAAPRAFRRNRRAWALLVFFGIGTGAYTLVLAWLPPFYTGLGWSPAAAGFLLGGLTLAEVAAGLAVSAWIGRFPDRRGPLVAVLLLLIAGLLCLITAPAALALPACLLLGVGIGALFPLSLIVALDHIDDPAQAGLLVAFVQGGGYIIASAMPLLAGVLRDRFASLTQAWVVMLAGALVLVVLGLRFSPASYRRIGP